MNFWLGTLVGSLGGAPIGAVLAYFWTRNRQPLGTADAPVDKLIRKSGWLRRLGAPRLTLLLMCAALAVTLVIILIVGTQTWNNAKDATHTANDALKCQAYNDRASTDAQIKAAEARQRERIAERKLDEAQVTLLTGPRTEDPVQIEQRLNAYLLAVREHINSVNEALAATDEVIEALKARDVECTTGIGDG